MAFQIIDLVHLFFITLFEALDLSLEGGSFLVLLILIGLDESLSLLFQLLRQIIYLLISLSLHVLCNT